MANKTNTLQLKTKLMTLAGGAAAKDISTTAYVNQILHAYKNQITQILPSCLTMARMGNIMVNAVRTTPKLAECSQESFIGSILQAAILGLEPNTPLGHAWLIPFHNKAKGVYECQLMPGYRGFLQLARRSGLLGSITAQSVREGDFFDYEYGFDEKLRHRPAEDYDPDAEITHAYAYAVMTGGHRQFVVMARKQILAIRDNSHGFRSALHWHTVNSAKAEQSGYKVKPIDSPWITHEDQMFAKTAIRRLWKLLPCSVDMGTLEHLDAAADKGESQGLGRVLEGEVIDSTTPQEEPAKAVDSDGTITAIGRQFMPREQELLKTLGFVPVVQENGQEMFISATGEIFDPVIHASQDDGSPVTDKTGFVLKGESAK